MSDDPFDVNDDVVVEDHFPQADAPAYQAPEAEAMIRRTITIIEQARPMPLSTSSMINKDEVLELLQQAVDSMPDELRAARWLLKEREEFLAKVRREGDDILEQSQTQAGRMVERTEVVRAAEKRARQIIASAEADASRMRLETEDFCDQKLGSFENVLERTMQVVHQGRSKLQRNPLADQTPAPEGSPEAVAALPDPDLADTGGFFDQDGS